MTFRIKRYEMVGQDTKYCFVLLEVDSLDPHDDICVTHCYSDSPIPPKYLRDLKASIEVAQ